MANDAAWQAGVDIAQGNKKGKKDQETKKLGDDKDSSKDDSSGNKKSGGMLGLMGKGASSLGKQLGMKHSGGMVKKTGNYRLRKGERVLTVTQQKAVGLKKSKKTGIKKRVATKR
jgi:hypothetical protein